MVSKIETLFLEKLSSRFLTVPCFDKLFETNFAIYYEHFIPESCTRRLIIFTLLFQLSTESADK